MILRSGDNVEHVVHPVAEIYISHTTFLIHDIRACCSSVMRMTGGVILSEITLSLSYPLSENAAVSLADTQDHPA